MARWSVPEPVRVGDVVRVADWRSAPAFLVGDVGIVRQVYRRRALVQFTRVVGLRRVAMRDLVVIRHEDTAAMVRARIECLVEGKGMTHTPYPIPNTKHRHYCEDCQAEWECYTVACTWAYERACFNHREAKAFADTVAREGKVR